MYHLFTSLLKPLPLLLLACLLVPPLVRRRWPDSKRGDWVAALLVALTWFCCTPLAGHLAKRSLEGSYNRLDAWPAERRAIVVLCAGVVVTERNGFAKTAASLPSVKRAMEARRLYLKHGPMPVVVSGGNVEPYRGGETEAACVAALLESVGVDRADLIEEERSRSTHENAIYSAEMLKERGIDSVVLVTHGVHMPRALGCFRAQGISCLPAPVTEAESQPTARWLIPSPDGVRAVHSAAHEWLGLAVYWATGRFNAG